MKSKVVVFDLDDTLYQEIDYLKSAYRYIADKIGFAEAYDDMLKWYYHGENAFENVIAKYHVDTYDIKQLLDFYRFHIPDISLKPEVLCVLDTLKDKVEFGIITDGRAITQWNKIKALKLECYIPKDHVLISEEVGYSKPDERLYAYFEDKYPGKEYFYIGDNPTKDFVTPNRRGWTSVCLLNSGENIHAQDFEAVGEEYRPNIKLSNFESILNYV